MIHLNEYPGLCVPDPWCGLWIMVNIEDLWCGSWIMVIVPDPTQIGPFGWTSSTECRTSMVVFKVPISPNFSSMNQQSTFECDLWGMFVLPIQLSTGLYCPYSLIPHPQNNWNCETFVILGWILNFPMCDAFPGQVQLNVLRVHIN